MNKKQTKQQLKKLISDYEKYKEHVEFDKLSETGVRTSFIDRLFEILGWNIRNPTETVMEEQRGRERLDYILKLGNSEALIIEAKKIKVNLGMETSSGIKASKQAIMYAWHKNCKFAVLTNFKELKVFHALFKPSSVNKHLLFVDKFGYFSLKYTDFLEKFDLLWLLSKENFLNKELEKYLSKKDIKISKPVDETILDDLFHYREWLSKDIKKLNPYLTKLQQERTEQEIIDEAVQHIIDRFIFIRSTEDRDLEKEDKLLNLIKDFEDMRLKKRLFFELIDIFEEFDKNYNSKLFEKSFIDTKIKISDEVITKIIKGLYFGVDNHPEKYNFKDISVDLLGRIYEQYLGVLLRTTELRARLKNGALKRKKMGIYYTPAYIVNYIVQNTIGNSIKNKNLDKVCELKLVDIACGSGSFLQSAFGFMATEVRRKIRNNQTSKKFNVFNTRLNEGKLWLGQKIQILRNNIFGVDLDEKAVDIAQLSLLLKLLEGEGAKTKKKLLPTMTDNIKCGNSLISDLEITDKAFNWEANFKDFYGKFDIVIGNPPYIDYRELEKEQTQFFGENFESAKVKEKYNILILFIEKGLQLLKEGGRLGFIVSNQFLCSDFGLKIREYILNNSEIEQIVDVSNIKIFKDASTYPIIIILKKNKPTINSKVKLAVVKEELDIINNSFTFNEIDQNLFKNMDKYLFIPELNKDSLNIIKRLKKNTILLGDFVENITWGTSATGYGKKKIKRNAYLRLNHKEQEKYIKIIQTADIERYGIDWVEDYLPRKIYTTNKLKLFKNKKLVIGRLNKFMKASLDKDNFALGKASLILCKNENQLKYLLGILNSKFIDYYYKLLFKSTHMSQGYIRYDIPYLKNLPIQKPTKEQKEEIIKKVDKILELNEKYLKLKESSSEKDRLKQQIDQIDFEINKLVYKLYKLTPEEINIVKGSVK